MNKKELKVGDNASISRKITENDIRSFAELCGDYNPMHIDKKASEKMRFGKPVCHGMLAASFISTLLGMYLPGEGTIYLEQTLKFLVPVYYEDTITAYVEIIDISEKNIITLKTQVVNQNGIEVIIGQAKVMI